MRNTVYGKILERNNFVPTGYIVHNAFIILKQLNCLIKFLQSVQGKKDQLMPYRLKYSLHYIYILINTW